MNQQEVEYLKSIFIARLGSFLQGPLKVDKDKTWDIGEPTRRVRHLYVDEVTATKLNGSTTGGGTGGSADTAKFLKGKEGTAYANYSWYASPGMDANSIPVLDGDGRLPVGVYDKAILADGTRTLEGAGVWTIAMDVSVLATKRIDNLHIGLHDHSGEDGLGLKIDHWLLLNNDANVHPQYTQRGVDELVTGAWSFTNEFEILRDPSSGAEIGRTPTTGWQFLPDLKQFTSVPYDRIVFSAEADRAQMWMGQNKEILSNINETDVSMQIGLGNDIVKMSGSDSTYRFWVGNTEPTAAKFSIDKTGFMKATSGDIAGWMIYPDRISGNNLNLWSNGIIHIGNNLPGSLDQVVLSSQDPEWRIWAGNNNAIDAPFRVSRWGQADLGDARVTGVLQSANYQSGTRGFSLDAQGNAEFNSILARGRIETAVFSKSKISAVSGLVIIAEAASIKDPVLVTDSQIVLDSSIFSRDDILYIKTADTIEVDGGYATVTGSEYLRVISEPIAQAADRWVYPVVRDLEHSGASPIAMKVGDTLVRQGSAVSNAPLGSEQPMYPFASGWEGSEFGTQVPGGSVAATEGGWLLLEGSRGNGPYFGVARREGPIYNQFSQVVRIGNLKGVHDKYTKITYGAFVGDAARYWSYDIDNGLEIKTRNGNTTINDWGIGSDEFTLNLIQPSEVDQNVTEIGMVNGYPLASARLYFVQDTAPGVKPRVGIKMNSGSQLLEITRIGDMSKDVWDADGDNKIDVAKLADTATLATTATHVQWSGVLNPPATYSPSAHTHPYTDINDSTEPFSRIWFGLGV